MNEITKSSATLPQSIAASTVWHSEIGRFISAARADSTRRAYQQDLRDFLKWGASLPSSPETVAAYVAARAHVCNPRTLARRLIGIGRAHQSKGFDDPTKTELVRAVMRGVRRTIHVPVRQVSPLLKEDLFTLLPLMTGARGSRDRALVLLGFAAALRRAEIVDLDVEDLAFRPEGLTLTIRRSKTDQEGRGRMIAVPHGRTHACPVKALSDWLRASQIDRGCIFRQVDRSGSIRARRLTPQSVSLILKRYVTRAGLDPHMYAGHSLRAGLVTSAARAGVATHKIQQQTGHKTVETLWRYIRDANVFENNAAGLLL